MPPLGTTIKNEDIFGGPSLADAFAELVGKRLAHETEAWCVAAIRRGPGWCVWRSDAIFDSGRSFTITHQFKILGPDESAPGSGQIYGPWPERLMP